MKKNQLGHIESGFKVPEGYFRDFEARMMEKITSEKEEKMLLHGENPFIVPEGYFSHFEDRLLERLQEQPKEPKVIQLFSRRSLSYVASVAAVLVVILTTVFLGNSDQVTFEDLDIVAVENYLLETLDMSNPETNLIINDDEFTFASSMNIDHEAVLEYINENVDEPVILLNEQ